MRVALFATCLADTMSPGAVAATEAVLERLGQRVEVPATQTCCGQMHMNSGYFAAAAGLARSFVDVFGGYDAVVSPSSSCVGAVRELYGPLLGVEHPVLERTYELSEFLVARLGVESVGARLARRVTYHPTCHSLRVTCVGDAPLRLLRSVAGMELVELPGAAECCGFGGTFAVKNAAVSAAILDDKLDAIEATGAEVCTALDSSCLLQIAGGLSRRGSPVQTMHLSEILASR